MKTNNHYYCVNTPSRQYNFKYKLYESDMKRKNIIKVLVLCLLYFILIGVNQNKKEKKPNILFIMTDQQSATMLSCMGNNYLNTPNLDKLAKSGVRFEKAYAANPVCVPSRFSIQTGLYPSAIEMRHNGSDYNKNRNSAIIKNALGNVFKNAGYDTYYGGKIHLPGDSQGIESFGYELITTDQRDLLAEEIASFLINRKESDKPFLCFTSFINPHDICYDAIRYFQPESQLAKRTPLPLDDASIVPSHVSEMEFFEKFCPPLPVNFDITSNQPDAIDSMLIRRSFRWEAREKWDEFNWRMHRWKYHRLTEYVDSQIGIVLDALEKSEFRKNTIVIFTSDHGDMDAAHRLEHKSFFYEEASRIPFIMAGKNIVEGKVDHTTLVNNGVDLLPTLCDLADINPPEGLPGKSITQSLMGKNIENITQHIFIEKEIGYMVTDGRFKYAIYNSGQTNELLIDLKTDPGEMHNLALNSSFQSKKKELRDILYKDLNNRINMLTQIYRGEPRDYHELSKMLALIELKSNK